MKGRKPTVEEQAHMDAIAEYGCYCCKQNGIYNDYILIHHVSGRTKPGAHFKTIPLCEHHHDYRHPGSVHHNKARWESIYGKQMDIVDELTEWYSERNAEQDSGIPDGYAEN